MVIIMGLVPARNRVSKCRKTGICRIPQ